ncbi:MAG: hypothetical protein R2862_01850 [Thermoanaerobaculia bacterium]
MRETTTIGALLLLLTMACAKQEAEPAAPAAPPAQPSTTGGTAGFALQRAHGEESSGTAASGLTFDLPAAWQRDTPSSAMRLAQATVPGAAGAGELAVFYFGPGQGGGVENNFERWLGQVQSDGVAKPERGSFEANGFRISWIDARGTLLPSGMGSGSGDAATRLAPPRRRRRGRRRPWFFKLTGPDATLAAEREPFLTMLRSVRRP